jgi:hypothetical protein
MILLMVGRQQAFAAVLPHHLQLTSLFMFMSAFSLPAGWSAEQADRGDQLLDG